LPSHGRHAAGAATGTAAAVVGAVEVDGPAADDDDVVEDFEVDDPSKNFGGDDEHAAASTPTATATAITMAPSPRSLGTGGGGMALR